MTLSISQTSVTNTPVEQTITGFSEDEIAHYAGKTLTLSDGSNSIEVDFSIAETTTNMTETIALIQAADGYNDLDFTVSEDAGTEDVILLTLNQMETRALQQPLCPISVDLYNIQFGVIIR